WVTTHHVFRLYINTSKRVSPAAPIPGLFPWKHECCGAPRCKCAPHGGGRSSGVCPARKAAGGAPPSCEAEASPCGADADFRFNPGWGGVPPLSAHIPGEHPGAAQPDPDLSQQRLIVAVMRRAAPPWASLTVPVGTVSLGLSYELG
ncbi:unnamed protein product, partial [Rangifer tarandus platyrhynchus]